MHIVYIHAITIHTIYYIHLTIHYVQYNTHITQIAVHITLYTIYTFCGYRYSHIAVHIHYTQYINIIDIDIRYITGHISQYIYNRL